MVDTEEITVHLWVWDKKGRLMTTPMVKFKHAGTTRPQRIQTALSIANDLWVKYPSSKFNKEVQIKEGVPGKKKVLKEKRNY